MSSIAKELRARILARRDAMPRKEIERLSLSVQKRLTRQPFYLEASKIMVYISFRGEVSTFHLIEEALNQGKRIFAPVTRVRQRLLEIYEIRSLKELKPGAYGILEPDPAVCPRMEPGTLDLVLVPGSVFSRQCGRYGYGGGFYDRFLSAHAPQAVRTALAFHFQLLDHIPLAPHDELMDYIVTDCETIECSGSRDRAGTEVLPVSPA